MARRRLGLAAVLVVSGTLGIAGDAGPFQMGSDLAGPPGANDEALARVSLSARADPRPNTKRHDATTVAVDPVETQIATANPVKVAINYYDVEGAGVAALWQSMRARGPRADGQPWAGHARWEVRWTYDWRAVPTGCGVIRAATELTIVYTLPRWIGRDAADPDMRDKWDRFADNLRRHEEGHGRHGERAAKRIRDAITDMAPAPDCQLLLRLVDERARQIVAEEAANDRAYDSATRHGLAQGVALN